MPIVELPNGVEIEFPEGMGSIDISRVIQRHSTQGQVLHSLFNPGFAEPYREGAREFALDVMPVTGEQRSVDRLGEMMKRFNQPATPIRRALDAADFTLEGGGLAAGVIPGFKNGDWCGSGGCFVNPSHGAWWRWAIDYSEGA